MIADRGVQPLPAGGHRGAVGEVRAQELPQGGARGDGDVAGDVRAVHGGARAEAGQGSVLI